MTLMDWWFDENYMKLLDLVGYPGELEARDGSGRKTGVAVLGGFYAIKFDS